MMTKRDYETLAACFREAPRWEDGKTDRASVAQSLALELSLDNPRFDREIFLAACKREDEKDD